MFGVIKGTKVGLLVDVSHLSYGPRLLDFQKNLLVSNSKANFAYFNILISFCGTRSQQANRKQSA